MNLSHVTIFYRLRKPENCEKPQTFAKLLTNFLTRDMSTMLMEDKLFSVNIRLHEELHKQCLSSNYSLQGTTETNGKCTSVQGWDWTNTSFVQAKERRVSELLDNDAPSLTQTDIKHNFSTQSLKCSKYFKMTVPMVYSYLLDSQHQHFLYKTPIPNYKQTLLNVTHDFLLSIFL